MKQTLVNLQGLFFWVSLHIIPSKSTLNYDIMTLMNYLREGHNE